MRTTLPFRNLFFLLGCWSLFFLTTAAQAQTTPVFGNEWINYGQPYYKIKVLNNGMHRLTYNDLVAAGITNVNPQKFQLFRRGKELAIYVNGQADGVLNAGDYIDFYGQKNDGATDSVYYSSPRNQIHKYYNLYQDTAAYFLTWGNTNGKRMAIKTSQNAGLTPENTVYAEKIKIFTASYFAGYQIGQTRGALGDRAEGFLTDYFGSPSIRNLPGSKKDTISNLTNASSAGRNPVLEVGVVSAFVHNSQVKVLIKPPVGPERVLTNADTGPTGLIQIPTFDYSIQKYDFQTSDIHPNGTVYLRVAVADSITHAAGKPDLIRMAYYKITYPRTTDLGNNDQIFYTDSLRTAPSYYVFDNVPANAVGYDITDPANVTRTEGINVGSQRGFVFDPSPWRRKIIIAKGETTRAPVSIQNANITAYANPANFDYIIVTHKSLRGPIAGTSGSDAPALYAAYRASAQGGSYSPLVVEIGDLYNQFHYGEKSAFAITNFMNWMLANGKPEHLFLMGKALDRLQGSPEGDIRTRPLYYKSLGLGEDLVPTFGFPASDILFTADWRNNSYEPKVSTGRLPVSAPKEIMEYLDKIKENELLGNEEWRKNILHLGGGYEEAQLLANYLNNYKNKVEGPLLGAKVKSIFRVNTGGNTPTKINIKNELNAGLSLITFFGHSSTNFSDLDIGFVSDPLNGYNNVNKYPMILMNGCNVGNAFTLRSTGNQKFTFGEDWLLTPNKGALLFLADVSFAVPFALNNYSSHFYNVAFTDSAFYGKPIGVIQKETVRRSLTSSPNNWEYVAVATEMVLQGDPAVKLYAPEKPDYAFKTNGLHLQSIPKGETVTANSEKFNIEIVVRNLGKAIEDSILIAVKRTLPNGSVIQYPALKFGPVFNEATILYPIDSKNVSGFGENRFEVFLDYGNEINELDETNNTAVLNQYLSVNGVIALLPKPFDIVSTASVKLIGQPANLLTAKRDYFFEIDTAPTFNSANKKTMLVQNAGNTPSWTTTLPANTAANDSVVYFWRFRFNTFGPKEDTIWATSSFRYIPNSPDGWSQSHYGQFEENELNQILIDPATKKFEFGGNDKELTLLTAGGGKLFDTSYGIFQNSIALTGPTCINPSGAFPIVVLSVFDNLNLNQVGTLTPGPSQSATCGLSFKSYYFHLNNASQVSDLATFIQNIPNGYYVAAITENTIPFSTFTQAQKDAFKLLGSNLINSLNTGDPFAIVGQKGATPAQAVLLGERTFNPADTTAANLQDIELTVTITGRGTQGTITSTRIGPATQWTTLHHTVRTSGRDEYRLDLYGYDKAGTRSLIEPDITNRTFSLASVDAQVYPYLQLQLALTDTADRSAPQLEQWLVVYQGVPEGMMRPDLVGVDKYNIDKDAANGKVNLRFAFKNISEMDFGDSLTVVRGIIGTGIQDTIKVKRLLANDSVFFDYSFTTGGLRGNNIVRVEVNPGILPEQYYFNNFLEVPFTLPNADLHPTLDVAFDGRRIMDGDIVSPNPKIAISLKDEDKYDFVKDPNKLEIFLKRPGSFNFERISLEDPTLVTLPDLSNANRDKREFNIIFHPKDLPDSPEGEDYQLRVQGSDNSEHNAGFEPYSINFKVVNESSITHFYPYPNPFSSNTRFVFTLTGNPENMPRNLKIQIMTLTGKVVREIQKEELGPIHVGNNMSLPWDGTDQFGDKLANGAYLYRVVMEKAPLEDMKHRKTTADKAFKKEYGKMYILR